MKRTSWSAGLSFSACDVGVISHAGTIAPRLLADRVGLTAELSKAMARRRSVPIHDRGRVLTDVAVMLAGDGETIADIRVLRHQSGHGNSPKIRPRRPQRRWNEVKSEPIGFSRGCGNR